VIHEEIMQVMQNKPFEDLCGPWEDEEWRFKWPHKNLQREEFCSQVPRHLTLNQTPKKAKKTGILAQEHTPKSPGAQEGALGA
jgi:hypothetical protein